jgi:hypothetical protein
MLVADDYRSHVHTKGKRNHPLNEREKAANRKRSKIRGGVGDGLLNAQPLFYLIQFQFIALPNVHQPLSNGLDELPLLLALFVFIEPLHDGYAAAPAGKQNGAVRIFGLIDHFAGIDFEVCKGDDVF